MDDGGSSLLYYWAVIQGTFSIPDWKNVVYGWRIFLPATLAAYLLGAVPFGLVLTRIAGIEDIRKTGSGNIGATNVLRTGSKRLAAATLLLDAGKGAAAVIAARLWLGPDVAFFAAIAVVLGHMFPVWLGFRGGKGVATMLGVLLALSWPAGLATVASWLAVAFVTRYSSLAALISIASAPLWCWLMGEPQAAGAAAILAVLVWVRHAGNIRRLLRGEETKIRLSRKTPEPAGR